ncbi:hypothetical protein AGMMS50233_04240 [Endomicrobiia bacterium]|nr:hypothetical protein AGMMS50233_04240 [Endomicrobiia bacterium]
MVLKNILATGGAGFIGSSFVPYFIGVHKEYNLINLDKLTYAADLNNLKEVENNERYKFVECDVCDRDLIEKLFKKYDIGEVIHFAAESHFDNSILKPVAFIRTNINGTFTFLVDVAKNYWADSPFNYKKKCVRCRFHHISTDEVYSSFGGDGLFTEKTPYSPNSPYSTSKASSVF